MVIRVRTEVAEEVSVELAVGKARSGWSVPGVCEWACCGWVCQWDVIEWDVLRVRQRGRRGGGMCRCVVATNVVSPPSVSRAVIPLHVSPLALTGASFVSRRVSRSHHPAFAMFALASHTQLSPWQSHTHLKLICRSEGNEWGEIKKINRKKEQSI